MLSKFKFSTVAQWRVTSIRPLFLFLAVTLVIAYPRLSHSAGNPFTKYLEGMQNIFKKSPKAEQPTKNSEEIVLSESEKRLYQKVKAVLEDQKRLESINKELTQKLAVKSAIITSLEYNEELLWNQHDANEKKLWDTLTAKDKEFQKTKELSEQLALKDGIIKTLQNSEDTLKAQLKDDKRKFETALSAIDPEYQPTDERVSLMPNSLFGYSPAATYERPLNPKGSGALDGNAVWYDDATTSNTTGNEHPWGSLVCTACHDGITNYDNTESSKNILWEDDIDVSEYMISRNLRSSHEVTDDYSKSHDLGKDSISSMRTWISQGPTLDTCNEQGSDSFCADNSGTDSWWRWFNQKIGNFKTNVAETVYSYL